MYQAHMQQLSGVPSQTHLAHIGNAALQGLGCIIHIYHTLLRRFIDTKDATNTDTSINVAAAIQRVKHHNVIAAGGLLYCDGVLLLLRGNYPL